jgi:tetratricopeptide (TPR) repeat protein
MARRSFLAIVVIGILTLAGILVTISIDREPEARKSSRIAYGEKQWNRAFNEAARRLREDPDDTAARLIQARSAARIGRDGLALEAYGRLPQRPEESEDLFLVGSILVRSGRAADGESLLSRAVDADPGHPEAAGFLTDFLFRNRRYEAARMTARKRLDAVPSDKEARLWLARVHDIVFEPQNVVELLGSRSNVSPNETGGENSATIRKLLSRNYLRLHEPLEALKILGERAEADRESLWLTSRAYLQLGRKPEAARYLEMSKAASGGEIGDQEEPSPYVGAASCRECHEEIHDDQQSSRHAMTFRYGDTPGDLPWRGFEKPDFHSQKLNASFDPTKQPLAFRFRDNGEEVRGLVKFIMGSGRHALTPVLEPADGSGPRESRWTWYAPVNDWDLTPGQPRVPAHPMDLMGVAQTPDMIRLCLGCHTTNPTEILARKGPTVTADRGIGCERCHGPGGNHVEASRLEFPDRAIGRFRRGSLGTRPQVMQACGECHGTIGRDLATGSDAAIVRFQSMTLSFSECFKQGQGMKNGFDCLTCHSPHRDVETETRFYDSKCLDCHRASDKAENDMGKSEQARTCKTGATNDCVRCHMPKIPSVQPHTRFTDHQIRVPKS